MQINTPSVKIIKVNEMMMVVGKHEGEKKSARRLVVPISDNGTKGGGHSSTRLKSPIIQRGIGGGTGTD
jgi:hypothetical protein